MITPIHPTYEQIITPSMRKTEALNQILRGERSAVEAYEQVLEKISEEPERIRLEEFLTTHRKNVEYWERQVMAEAMKPDDSSGPWGYIVQAFVGTAKLFGNTATLSALKQGEEHGLNEYQTLIENPEIDVVDKRYVRNVIIPELEKHLISIEAMKQLH